MNQLKAFDTFCTRYVAKLPSWLKAPFTALAHIASPFAWGIIMLVFITLEQPSELSVSMLILVALPLATFVKFAFRRQRPPTIYAGNMRIKSYSFPSSHAYASALAGVFFASVAWNAGMLALAVGLLFYAALIAVSRVYLGAHYPSDVIAGFTLGTITAIGIILGL